MELHDERFLFNSELTSYIYAKTKTARFNFIYILLHPHNIQPTNKQTTIFLERLHSKLHLDIKKAGKSSSF